MGRIFTFLLVIQCGLTNINAQDTFSIVAVDSTTGEVGAAGASCVDLNNIGDIADHFLAELFPGSGAIATQAWYQPGNQAIARQRMMMGEHPDTIIQYLVGNDVQGQPGLRQYGIAAIRSETYPSAGYTGAQTDDYKGHITGPGYSIQGNILLGPEVLESMEAHFLEESGSLQCRLMAALQGANMVGADSRCAPNGTSSLFAFIKVAGTEDVFGEPSFIRSVRTAAGDGIEPIDSLQKIFDTDGVCSVSGTGSIDHEQKFRIYPNPCRGEIFIENATSAAATLTLFAMDGAALSSADLCDQRQSVDMQGLTAGVYYLHVKGAFGTNVYPVVRL